MCTGSLSNTMMCTRHADRTQPAVCHMVTHPSLQVTAESMEVYPVTDRVKWVVSWPGQAVLCISQMYWTTFMHQSIRNGQKVGSPQCRISKEPLCFQHVCLHQP